MNRSRIYQWSAAFSVLLLYSIHALMNISGHAVNAAYAEAIADDPVLAAHEQQYILAQVTPANARNNALTRVINRFTQNLKRQEELCTVDSSQVQELTRTHNLRSERVSMRGRDITVVRGRRGNVVTRNQLETLNNGNNVHCRLVDVYEHIILTLSARLS